MDQTLPQEEGIFAEQERIKLEALEAKKREGLLDADLRSVLSTTTGRRALKWILDQTGLFESVSSTDPTSMALLSGRRDAGLAIARRLQSVDESLFYQIFKESDR
jgi:hypothetical protein